MRSVSVYTITRNQNIKQLQKMEQHLSGREYPLNIQRMGIIQYERVGKSSGKTYV